MLTLGTHKFSYQKSTHVVCVWYVVKAKLISFLLLFISFQSDMQNGRYVSSKMREQNRVGPICTDYEFKIARKKHNCVTYFKRNNTVATFIWKLRLIDIDYWT